MADIRVGVKRITQASGQLLPGADECEVTQQWVEINGQRIVALEGLRDVAYGVDEPGGAGMVTIRVYTSSFTTVGTDDG